MTDDRHAFTPGRAGLAAADLAAGVVVAIDNGILTRMHAPELCAGTDCWVDSPSVHSMNGWPVHWRPDSRTAERICEHGFGHPDPDDPAFRVRAGRNESVRGCDGCCGP